MVKLSRMISMLVGMGCDIVCNGTQQSRQTEEFEVEMRQEDQRATGTADRVQAELLGLLHEPLSGQRWTLARQHKIWRPPTDVYETDSYVVVKVEIAGMEEGDFDIALDSKRLIITGVRHDPAAKLAYQQMEILYGQFETEVYVLWAVDEDKIEATYRNGFLNVFLPKVQPRQVPVINMEDSS
jgi:HSP20 family molecular chaperone IbpA